MYSSVIINLKDDNWFYNSNKAYDQAAGVGVPDVANLLEALKNLE